MKTLNIFCIALFFCHSILSQNVGIGTTAPKTNLHLVEDHSVLFGKDTIGVGAKLMWLPDLSAFRVGFIGGSDFSYWDRDSIGEYSFASGANTRATGLASTAMGNESLASGSRSTAMGYFTNATGSRSTAMGESTHAKGRNSTAMGYFTVAGQNSTAMGRYSNAIGNASTAMGNESLATGFYSTAMGGNTTATGDISTAMGSRTQAQSYNSTAIGKYNIGGGNATDWVDDDPIFEIGIGQSEGTRNNALTILKDGRHGILTHEPKTSLHVAEDHQVLFGKDTIGEGAKMMWHPDLGAFRAGNLDVFRSTNWDRDSIGLYSFASGHGTKATETASIAMGLLTQATGEFSVALGRLTNARGESSFAMGRFSNATGNYSTAVGSSAEATGNYSTSIGGNTNAEGEYSFAMGRLTDAIGYTSTAMGNETEAVGNSSTAMGRATEAIGFASTAMGNGTNASGSYSTALGRYNNGGGNPNLWVEEDPIFEIGIGGSVNTRDNALTVLKNGRHGIRTTTPKANLHVKDDGANGSPTIVAVLESSVSARPVLQFAENPNGDANSGMSIEYNGVGSGSNNKMHINDITGSPIVTFESGGQVGLGITSPTFALQLTNSSSTGVARAHSWTTYSDERIKSDEHILSYGLREIMLLKPLSYKQHNSSIENSKLLVSSESENTIGFFAQEVHKVIPEAAIKPENEDEQLWGMEYEKLIPVLVKGIQELVEEIEMLKAKLDAQEAKYKSAQNYSESSLKEKK